MVREWMLRNVIRVCPKSGRFVGFRFKHRWLWPIVGTTALVWFIVRVAPKPTRATYPCQQWVAPIAAGFLGWLLSLIGATWAFRKVGQLARQNRLVVASAFALLGLAAVGWNAWSVSGDASAANGIGDPTGTYTPSDAANAPVGTATGLFPGRVAWIHNPNATSYAGTGYWWEDMYNDQSTINDMLSQVVRSVSGQSSVASAWDALFKYRNQQRGKGSVGYQSTEKIAIKLNLNSGGGTSNKVDASPHVAYALLDQLVNVCGVPQANITLYDAQRGGISAVKNRCSPTFPNVKYNTWGTWVVEQLTYSSIITDYGARRLPQAVVEAEYMINFAVLKRHCSPTTSYSEDNGQTGVTLCGKNHFGTIGNTPALHVNIRDWFWGMATYNPVVDLIGSKHLGGKTVLYLMDGLYAGDRHDGVPKKWLMAPFNNDWPSSLFASLDPVAIDSVGLDFLRTEWSLVANADNYLHEAASRDGSNRAPSGVQYKPDGVVLGSLGAHEHWNNPTEKKYSRNLGTGNGIELVALHGGGGETVSCTITAPAQNALFNEGSSVAIQASTSSSTAGIAKVEFFRNGTLLATDTNAADGWTCSWTNAAWGNYSLTARATSTTGATAMSSAVTVWVLRPPENPSSTVNGLDYQYYEGTWDVLPNFDSLTVAKFGTSANVDMGVRNRDEYYGLRFRGYVQAPTDGIYHFYVSSDDGSKLLIGTTEVVNNDGLHGTQEVSGAIGLKAGKHAVTVTFFQKAGGQALSTSWDGPGISKQAIPDARLWRAVTNQAPQIDSFPMASPNPVQMPNATTCSAVASDDNLPNSPGTLKYTWSKQSGPGTVTFGSNNGTSTGNTCTATFSAAGEYVLLVTVSDGELTDTATVAVSVQAAAGLPAPWKNQDVGSVGLSGNATYSSGAFTIKGGGDDIWNAADAFHFVYQSLNGDGEIVARVTSVQNTNVWAKTGVMMRETLTASSKHAMMVLTPGNGLAFQYRATTGGSSNHVTGGAATAPRWVKLTRAGNTLTGYASADGATWTQVGSATIPMATSIFVGMPATAHNNSVLCTAVLDNVSVKVTAVSVKVNFQPAGRPIPTGYQADTGAVFGDRGNGYSYGWNLDNSTTARDRDAANSADQRYDTLQHLQKTENPNAVWEIAVPNGTYRVHAVSGDALFIDSVFKLNVEGVLAVDGTPTSAQHWSEGTVTVTVNDGRLTIGNGTGAANNKVCFVEIDRQ